MSFGPTGSSKGGRSRETCLTCVFTFCIEDSRGLPADPASARAKLSGANTKQRCLYLVNSNGLSTRLIVTGTQALTMRQITGRNSSICDDYPIEPNLQRRKVQPE